MKFIEIEDKADEGTPLSATEREFLLNGLFAVYFKNDDPKYDDANMEWLGGMTDEALCYKYREICLT
jgi:hypothetical protein